MTGPRNVTEHRLIQAGAERIIRTSGYTTLAILADRVILAGPGLEDIEIAGSISTTTPLEGDVVIKGQENTQ
jgi:hypothetical protein